MKLTFPNKTEFETDIILDILNKRGIKYKYKRLCSTFAGDIYDINVEMNYEDFINVNEIVKEKIKPYIIATKSFALPSFTPIHEIMPQKKEVEINITRDTPIFVLDEIHQQLNNLDVEIHFLEDKSKKSMLLKLIDWIKGK